MPNKSNSPRQKGSLCHYDNDGFWRRLKIAVPSGWEPQQSVARQRTQACSCLTHPHLFRQGGQGFGEHLNSFLNVRGFGVHEGKSKAFTIRCGIEFAKAAEFLIGEMKQADCS